MVLLLDCVVDDAQDQVPPLLHDYCVVLCTECFKHLIFLELPSESYITDLFACQVL